MRADPDARTAAGPRGYPIVGHLPAFLADKLGFLTRCAARYGDVVRLRLGEPTFLLSDPEDIKHVLIANAENYEKSPRLTSARGKRLSGSGLLTSVGEAHRVRRRQMQPAFHRSSIEPFSAAIARGTAEMLARWGSGGRIEVGAEMMRLAQTNIVRILFGDDCDDRADELARAIAIRRRYMEHVFFVPLGGVLPSRIGAAHQRALGCIDEIVGEAIRKRREDGGAAGDLLSHLVRASDDGGATMTDAELRDEVVTLLVTGHETVGEALAWTWFLLARHPEAAAAMWREVDGVSAGRAPCASELRELRFTARVLNESMRLYPPTWIFIRMTRDDDALPSGARIGAGAKIYLCQYVVHRHPRYFPDPERFDPERFSDAERQRRPQFAYFPFGGGGRVCIGEALARLQLVQVLASIAQRFSLTLIDGQTIVPEPSMTLRAKHGIWMTARRRP